ncbi:hypothetical protein JR065_17410 [Xanthomonas sp. AmX2]|uniref:hypothetical protein n=1 Tax=Xanthomonas sp. TaxID=29446 RepID=UPI00197F16E4|nr:hypothetical protein [Xanthomonas sp.]MBN6152125.1 hypothetical protein [Xanthomonas sp.]
MLLPAAVAPADAGHASLARLAAAAAPPLGGISALPLCSADARDLLLAPVARAAHAAPATEAIPADCRGAAGAARAAARCVRTHGTDRDGPAAGNAA